MSEGTVTKIESDRYTRIVAESVKKALTDRDFLMTMRFSSLYKDEEFDNAQIYTRWHFLFETGINQMKGYVERLKSVLATKKVEIMKQPDGLVQADARSRIHEILYDR